MGYTKLADVLTRALWTKEFRNDAPFIKSILNSGIFTIDPRVDSVVNSAEAGQIIEIPFINTPDYIEPSIADDSTNEIISTGVNYGRQYGVLGLYAKSWGTSLLAEVFSSSDPLRFFRDYVGRYWGEDLERRIVMSLRGILGANINSNNGDLVLDVADDTEDGAPILLDASILIDAKGLVGELQDSFQKLFVHSKVYQDLQKQNLVEVIPPSEQAPMGLKKFGDYELIVSDLMPVIEGDNKKSYVSVIAKRGAFVYSQKDLSKTAIKAVEYYNNPKAGNGAGIEELISRNAFLVHPLGWSFDKAKITNVSPSLADLATPDVWSRVYRQQNTNFIFVITN
ncbi:MAG: hypothetical protein C6I01_01855 [Epsilonproteobacteria bacterium]|nr:hypothetical protein [Campylobacterota bacterium]